jgi:metal-sulfur cluster biosynthetic enzyme
MLSEQDILTTLRDCFDPALPCNIVDLGLVRNLQITPDPEAPGAGIPGVPQKHLIQIELALINSTDEVAAQLTAQVRNRLAGLEERAAPPSSPSTIPPGSQQITPRAASRPRRQSTGSRSASHAPKATQEQRSGPFAPRPPQARNPPHPPLRPDPLTDTSGLVLARDLATGHPNDEHVTPTTA